LSADDRSPPPPPQRNPARALAPLVPLALLVLLVIAAFHWVPGLALLGYDSYPLIAAARVQSVADLAGLLGDELMGGRFPTGRFYRPLVHASFALDYAISGLAPLAYHATDLAVLVANGAFVAVLTRRLFGERPGARSALAGVLAAVLFVLHPVQVEVVPVPPRRADALCLLFLLWASIDALGPRGGRLCGLRAGLLAWCAAASKETGVAVGLLVFALHFQRAGAGALRARLARAARASAACWSGVALYLAMRTLVFGGLGGHDVSFTAGLARMRELALPFLARVLYPQPFLADQTHAPAAILLAGAALVVLAAALAWRPKRAPAASQGLRRGLAFLAIWCAALFAVSSLAGLVEEWYALVFVAAWAMLAGLLLAEAAQSLLAGRARLRAALTLALVGALALSHVRYSALFHAYDEWPRASAAATEFLARYESELRASPQSAFVLEGLRPRIPAPLGPGARSVVLLHGYSLEAYAELLEPPCAVEVAVHRGRVQVTPRGAAE